ncbi:MAG: SAM-dependent methyltransferase, partial [Methylobacteriaceae bacterium]|nr:SAM-dependent methyltransferase [Methylobacteriaceae bacterium]
ADVLVYLGDLAPVMRAVARVLSADGLFAFTVQHHPGEGFALGADHRYAHSDTGLRDAAADAGLTPALLEATSTREERGEPVPGRLAVLRAGAPGRDQARAVRARF